MAACHFLEKCHFFNGNISETPSAASDLRIRYCYGGGHVACARYVVCKKLGEGSVPKNLFPDQQNRLNEILGFI